MTLVKQTRRKRQRGVAIIMALLALLLLSVIGMAFLFMATTENSANTNYKDSQKSYFGSRAGLENVRSLLWTNAAFNNQVSNLTMPVLGTNTGVIYVFNPNGAGDVIDPSSGAGATVATNSTLDDELCQEQYTGLQPGGPAALLSSGTPLAPCGSGGATEVMPKVPSYYQAAALNPGDIPNTGTSSALPFKWVRITNKQNFMGLQNKNVDGTLVPSLTAGNQVCWDGVHEVAAASCAAFNLASLTDQVNPVWLLTSLAITPGGARRMTQMEVAFTPPITTNATIATSGTLKLTGKVTVNGDDDCTANKAHMSIYSGQCVPGQNGCQGSAITNLVPPDQLTGNNGGTGVTAYDPTTGAITSPGSTGQGAWPYNVDQLISQYKQMAQVATASPWNYNTTCSGNNCKLQSEQFGTFPTDPVTGLPESAAPVAADGTPAIVYVPGSLHLTSPNATGDGLLIVDGDLTVDGGMTYYGLILVKGQIHFTGGGKSGAQGVNIFGSILAGDSASAADAVGGTFSFHYSSCALKQSAPPGPPHLIATHELMF